MPCTQHPHEFQSVKSQLSCATSSRHAPFGSFPLGILRVHRFSEVDRTTRQTTTARASRAGGVRGTSNTPLQQTKKLKSIWWGGWGDTWSSSYPGADDWGGRSAGRRAARWSSGSPSRWRPSTCWPGPGCWSSSLSSTRCPQTGTRRRGARGTRVRAGSR